MMIAALTFHLHLPGCASLKEATWVFSIVKLPIRLYNPT